MPKNAQLSFPYIYTVEASAGGGKTYILAQQYLWLVLNSDIANNRPANILAITFTNKAAAEMKGRILEFLKQIALDYFPQPQKKESLKSFLRNYFSPSRAKEVLESILKNYEFFSVQTIDSFIRSLLASSAYYLDLSPSFLIEDDFHLELKKALDDFIQKSQEEEKAKKALQGFLIQYLQIDKRASWFPKQDILRLAGNLFEEFNRRPLDFKRPVSTFDIFANLAQLEKLLGQLIAALPSDKYLRLVKSLHTLQEKVKNKEVNIEFPAVFQKQLPPKEFNTSPSLAKLWRKIKSAIQAHVEGVCFGRFFVYQDLFVFLQKELQAVRRQKDILFLPQLNKEVSLIFEKGLLLSELYLRLATRFYHYLIDEFQDTSLLQWENLKPLVAEALSVGGSLFYVGDRKQAIFRFRAGRRDLFEKVKKEFSGRAKVTSRVLDINYRSARKIVEFNNYLFSSANLRRFLAMIEKDKKPGCGMLTLREEDKKEILNTFLNAGQKALSDKEPGYVKLDYLEAGNKSEEEDIVKVKLWELLADLKQRFSWQDVAVLLRDNSQVYTVTNWLLEAKIPVDSEKTLDIRQNPFIKEIIAFLKFLHSPIDELSFAAFISGKIFSTAAKITQPEIRNFLFSARLSHMPLSLYHKFRTIYPLLWQEFIEEFFQRAGFLPLYEFVISIFARFNIWENFSAQQAFFLKFLELIKKREEEGESSLSDFLDYYQNSQKEGDFYIEAPHTSSAVKVTTIHKAKGLEFEAVIVPFLKINPSFSRQNYIYAPNSQDFSFIFPRRKWACFSPRLFKFLCREYREMLLDELSNAYVALTRAKKELYVFVAQRKRQSNLAIHLIGKEKLSQEWGQKNFGKKPSVSQEGALFSPPNLSYVNWLEKIKEEFPPSESLLNKKLRQRGEILHYALSCLGNLDERTKEECLRKALSKTQLKFNLEDLSDIEKTITALIKNSAAKRFFFCREAEVFLEKEIVDKYGKTSRLDRLIVKAQEAWVVDYKSGQPKKEDILQVKEYCEIVQLIYPKKKVSGFLLYLESGEVREV